MKCTMQWGKGCDADATHEVRQNHRDDNNKILETHYHLAFTCEAHIPKKDPQNYLIAEISNET